MTHDDALRIQQDWRDLAIDPMCYHPVIGPIRDHRGLLTGEYVCIRCGADIFQSYDAAGRALQNAAES